MRRVSTDNDALRFFVILPEIGGSCFNNMPVISQYRRIAAAAELNTARYLKSITKDTALPLSLCFRPEITDRGDIAAKPFCESVTLILTDKMHTSDQDGLISGRNETVQKSRYCIRQTGRICKDTGS